MTRFDRIRATLAEPDAGPVRSFRYEGERAVEVRYLFEPLTFADDDAIDAIWFPLLGAWHSYEEALILYLLIGRNAD